MTEFEAMFDNLLFDPRERSTKVIIGDFNAWAFEWGSREANARGRSLLEDFTQLNVVLANEDEVNSFRKEGLARL